MFDLVIMNPPYLGSKHHSPELRKFLAKEYPDTKGDLYTAFMEYALNQTKPGGLVCAITPHNWMFLSSSQKLRAKILQNHFIKTLIHLGDGVFKGNGGVSGAVVTTAAYVLEAHCPGNARDGLFVRMVDEKDKEQAWLQSRSAVMVHQTHPVLGHSLRAKSGSKTTVKSSPQNGW